MPKEVSLAEWVRAVSHSFSGQAPAPDLVEELHDRLGAVWRYGECLAEAEGEPQMQRAWREAQSEELSRIRRLRQVLAQRIEEGEFFEEL